MTPSQVTPSQRLEQLGLELPPAPAPVGSYLPCVRTGDLIFTSGQLPMLKGQLQAIGKVGAVLTMEQAAAAARLATLNGLAVVAAEAGGLERIRRIVRVGVYVNSSEGFTDQPKVANGASDLLAELFGEAGRHARSAVGCNELPLDAAVEVEMVVQVG